MKVYLETMGCQMNRLDSELVYGALRADGHEMVHDPRGADVVLYNTCSVRRHAEEKVYSRLGAEAKLRSAGRKIIVGVLGCMAQREGEGLRRRCPTVDIICSPGQIHRLAEILANGAGRLPVVALDPPRSRPRDDRCDAQMDAMDLSRDTGLSPTPSQAYVRVARGCDRFCTYCIVPFVRGSERSRNPEHVVEEVRRLVGAGRTAITLLGQTVNRYRYRAGEVTVRFCDLLERVAGIDGIRRVRFITSHPVDFDDDILRAMRGLPAVCEYVHCPAQSGSDAVLARMNRGHTRAEYDHFVDRARAIVPNVALAGDFIVGFPGETQADHEASIELIRRSRYKNSFVFKYSPRPGTAAAMRFTDDVPADVKKHRNNELLAVQQEVGLEHHRAWVGAEAEVLVEGSSPRADRQPSPPPEGHTQLLGRTRGDHIVVFNGRESLAGEYVKVEITDATSLTLFGKLVAD